MSDAINDVERDNDDYRRSHIDVKEAADMLRTLRRHVCDYEEMKTSLIKLGYKIEENGLELKIWKQI